jgi:hypothetical protein
MAKATQRKLNWKDVQGRPFSTSHRATSPGSVRRMLIKRGSARAVSSVYIVHDPAQEQYARLLSEWMENTLGEVCQFEVPGEISATERSLEHLSKAKYVLLLQTKHVLEKPWVLLALYRAVLCRVPMVCVMVVGSGYDFGNAKDLLENVHSRLDEKARLEVTSVLSKLNAAGTGFVRASQRSSCDERSSSMRSPGREKSTRSPGRTRLSTSLGEVSRRFSVSHRAPHNLSTLSEKLVALIPSLISVVLNPAGSDNELAATVRDIQDKQRALSFKLRPPSSKKLLLREKAVLKEAAAAGGQLARKACDLARLPTFRSAVAQTASTTSVSISCDLETSTA